MNPLTRRLFVAQAAAGFAAFINSLAWIEGRKLSDEFVAEFGSEKVINHGVAKGLRRREGPAQIIQTGNCRRI